MAVVEGMTAAFVSMTRVAAELATVSVMAAVVVDVAVTSVAVLVAVVDGMMNFSVLMWSAVLVMTMMLVAVVPIMLADQSVSLLHDPILLVVYCAFQVEQEQLCFVCEPEE